MSSDSLWEGGRDFDLDIRQLLDIAWEMERRIVDGLSRSDEAVKCLPAYIPLDRLPQAGRAVVVDIGGTHVRAALMELKEGAPILIGSPIEDDLPASRNLPLPPDIFFDVQARLIAGLNATPGLPMGYCFSYPALQTPDRDALLLSWTKELSVPGVEGKAVGRLLSDHLNKNGIHVGPITVLNDSVASLIAGCAAPGWDALIGLIVGTGYNMALLMEQEMIPKLGSETPFRGRIAVNLECGNLSPPHLTACDAKLDALSQNAGRQRIEKAVGGGYLGALMKCALPSCQLDPRMGSAELVRLAGDNQPKRPREAGLARLLLRRSALLVAAGLAGAIGVLNNHIPRQRIRVVMEGGLIQNAPGYKEEVARTLDRLLDELGMGHQMVSFVRIPHANLTGSALAALAGHGDNP